jgi:hemerythrin
MYIHWKKTYETGHPLIDAEHRILVMLFRKLDIAIKTREPEATISRIVLEVKRYVQFHFASEENLMYETNYPYIEEHIAVHTHLLVKLNNMMSKLTSRQEFPDDVLDFLSDWLTKHISQHDKELAVYVDIAADRPVAESIYPEYLRRLCKIRYLTRVYASSPKKCYSDFYSAASLINTKSFKAPFVQCRYEKV